MTCGHRARGRVGAKKGHGQHERVLCTRHLPAVGGPGVGTDRTGEPAIGSSTPRREPVINQRRLRHLWPWQFVLRDLVSHPPGTPSRDLFLAWVQGFLTATGGFNDEQRKTTTEGIQASISMYCLTHPLDTIEVAASTLFVTGFDVQSAAPENPALFIAPTGDNLEAFLAAAITNKQVPSPSSPMKSARRWC